jgi:hypothetical protein
LRELDLSGKSHTNWYFDNCNQLVQHGRKFNQYKILIYLKVELSVPAKSTPDFYIIEKPNLESPKVQPSEESAQRLALFNVPAFSEFKVCVDNETFYVRTNEFFSLYSSFRSQNVFSQ